MLFPVNHRHDRRHQGQKTFSLGEPSAIDGAWQLIVIGSSDGQLWAERPGGVSFRELWNRSAEVIKLRSSA